MIPAASSAGVFVFREIHGEELCPELFSSFIRRQSVHDCWRRSGSSWEIRPDPFIDDWTCDDILELLHKMRKLISAGGLVYGAFSFGHLKGFAAVDSRLFGSSSQYADLAELHVSEDARRLGVGRALFQKAAAFALGSFTSLPIPLSRASRSISRWAARRRRSWSRGMSRKSLMIASWSMS